jgi:hypothetical protein
MLPMSAVKNFLWHDVCQTECRSSLGERNLCKIYVQDVRQYTCGQCVRRTLSIMPLESSNDFEILLFGGKKSPLSKNGKWNNGLPLSITSLFYGINM